MSTRVFLTLLIVFSLLLSYTLSSVFNPFEQQVTGLLPEVLVPYAAYLIIGIPVALIFFIIIDYSIVRPLRRICVAMTAFAQKDERPILPEFRQATRELREFPAILRQLSERIDAAHARDAEISRVKSDFISTAAHQLRTPLTGIRWALEALEKEPLTEDQRLLIASATEKSHDLTSIVGTLLDISSIESGKHAYQFATANIQQLIAGVVQDFMPAATEAKVNLRYDPGPGPLVTRMDSERIKWVLNNLIENGIRYTPANGRVQVTSMERSGRLIVQVRDTGIGIPQKDRNNIFERFYRAGNAITKQNQGNGLGLYIARAIVQGHGGELSFENNPDGLGTTFTMALPSA